MTPSADIFSQTDAAIPDDGSVFEIDLPPLHIKVTEIKGHRIKKAIACFSEEA